MQFRFEVNEGWYLTHFSGDIDFSGLLLALKEFEIMEKNNPPFFNRVTDLRETTSIELDYNEVSGLAKKRMMAYLPDKVKSAFIVSNDEQHGFARMFFSLNSHPKIEFKIFNSLQDGIDWANSTRSGKQNESVGSDE
ncbi:MAG: hypothetical protein COA79_12450 [Planctomycetota bacterium]|nr:MAG: hypothetical protein COA79_12450 [Planctomycetota bacterium]